MVTHRTTISIEFKEKLKSDRIRKHRAGLQPLSQDELDSISKILGIAFELPFAVE
ncbi:MAG: hypothetical protein HC820_02225 [Hydrococcus sp. RM1_1_31]|nr:hypothetical protein [Hydrococcus sp. RM1_1_31]